LDELDLGAAFEPKSMAVIGVSLTNPFHPANIVYNKNYYGHTAEVYAVNPKGGWLERRPVYRSVGEIPGKVDMAFVAVKAHLVPRVARECAAAGVRTLVVISGGFAETGEEGASHQEELVEMCRKRSMVMFGPNCLGIYSPPSSTLFSFPPRGRSFLPRGISP